MATVISQEDLRLLRVSMHWQKTSFILGYIKTQRSSKKNTLNLEDLLTHMAKGRFRRYEFCLQRVLQMLYATCSRWCLQHESCRLNQAYIVHNTKNVVLWPESSEICKISQIANIFQKIDFKFRAFTPVSGHCGMTKNTDTNFPWRYPWYIFWQFSDENSSEIWTCSKHLRYRGDLNFKNRRPCTRAILRRYEIAVKIAAKIAAKIALVNRPSGAVILNVEKTLGTNL